MREFNITGVCVSSDHYMVNISSKLDIICNMIDKGKYFTINRSRQYGKTTTLSQLYNRLKHKYLVLRISFESLGDSAFANECNFCKALISLISAKMAFMNINTAVIDQWKLYNPNTFAELSLCITDFCRDKHIVLMIDEVDKSSDNQLFLNFLGMLRSKYLDRNDGSDFSFKSVVLAGVYDIKNLKLKITDNTDKKYNSPWNIAADFKVDMSFNSYEISTMLLDYLSENQLNFDVESISNEIYRFTNGYPFLVSKLCKIIDEELNKDWTLKGVEHAVKLVLVEKNTLFDDIFKNLENNSELYNLIYEILVQGRSIAFNIDNPIIALGEVFGILSNKNNSVCVANTMFEIRIYNYYISKKETSNFLLAKYQEDYIIDGRLNMELILNKFKQFMYEEYRKEDEGFLEKHGRLLFLSFIKPIINGVGFYFVESETRDSRRMDVVITYNTQIYIIELKLWYGGKNHEKAYEQLSEYLSIKNEHTGYLITFDFSRIRKNISKWVEYKNTNIYSIII